MKKIKNEDIRIENPKPMDDYEFQSAVLDWFARIEELLEDIKNEK